jgi:hypothetical protein
LQGVESVRDVRAILAEHKSGEPIAAKIQTHHPQLQSRIRREEGATLAIKLPIAKLILKAAQGQTIYKHPLMTARTKSRQLFPGAEFSMAAPCLTTARATCGAGRCWRETVPAI